MSETSHKNPAWQQAEIDFLLRNGIVSWPQQVEEFNHIKSRWVYRTLREVLLTPSGHVLKRFTHFPGRHDHRRVWLREHAALTRLDGFSAPKSLGFITARHTDNKCTSVLYAREMIPGRPIGRVDDTVLEKIAKLLAQFHRRGVVTLDPQPDNFIVPEKDPDSIAFIDFGRSRFFRPGGLLMLVHIGKEIHRLRIEAGLDQSRFDRFLTAYLSAAQLAAWQERLVQASYRLWRKRHGRKYGGQ